MPNLVGIGNSQVPTNAMLGGLAYQDSVGEINIEKIKARTSDTATDIFVYDTSKDSDGGAWRKRTQNTSWYNEGVSATRGARKEFPAVAVIVAEQNFITIYDGDDPNLSMWMVFEANTDSQDLFINDSSSTLTSIAALNGRIFVGSTRTSTTGNITGIDFIGDRGGMVYTSSSDIRTYNGGVGQRNDGLGNTASTSNWFTSGAIVNRNVNDVAMTVLPNAPIDASTGLPVPTIAVATDGGTSIIKDNGTISDLTPGGGVEMNSVSFDENNNLVMGRNNFILYRSDHSHYLSNQVDNGYTVNNRKTSVPSVGEDSSGSTSFTDVVATSDSSIAFDTQTLGLGLYDVNAENNSNSMVAYIRTNYNTGWMHGDIKGAFLSDTDDTNVTGEKVDLTTGSSPGTGNWSSISANSIVAGSTSDAIGRWNTGTDGSNLVVGRQYSATLTISNYSGSGDLGVASGAGFDSSFRYSANGTYHTYITYNSGGVQLFYRNTNTATIGFSLKEVDLDRSVNNKGLAIHGTITKTPVATGAELVAYSGFSSSNYLKQSGSDKILFGTGDFSIIFWVKYATGNNNQSFIDISSTDGGIGDPRCRIHQFHTPAGSIRFYTTGGNVVNTSNRIDAGWTCVVAVRRSSGLEIYINGVLEGSGNNSTTNFNNSAGQMVIGMDGDGSDPLDNGSITLVRVSLTTPSPEQIKKIYNDEKCLFHENAKCTLHGTSDDVKALAFDDTNGVLHVGTSAGRSEFQGLNRINNTTTAVTTAISVSDGFVAEQ